ncbi:MAG: S41 family peptidase [Candidatus Saccharicenans sp.]
MATQTWVNFRVRSLSLLFLRVFVLSVIMNLSYLFLFCQQPVEKVNRPQLIEDLRQLLFILENSHPDPYLKGGGKIAFHRRFQEALLEIPEEGMSRKEFYRFLMPLMASVGDGHTFLVPPWTTGGESVLPIGMNIVGQTVYVEKVFRPGLEHLFGSRLISVNDIPFPELIERLKSLISWDNEYQLLTYFCRFLNDKELTETLIPELRGADSLRIGLELPKGQTYSLEISRQEKGKDTHVEPPSRINLPSTEKVDFAYNFLDPRKRTALLRIDGMFSYRENFEFFRSMGAVWVPFQAAAVYRKIYLHDPPENLDSLISAIPSATEVFRNLVIEMKKAGTERLIIDLRKNSGGNSLMANILAYFLFSEEQLKKTTNSYAVKKYSDLYFANYPNDSLEKINKVRRLSLDRGDYDFGEDPYFKDRLSLAGSKELELEEWLKATPTFYKEYKSGLYKNYYRPPKIIIVSSAWTYSSAFTLMSMFYKLGARVVGVPSGQSGTCFGDTLSFILKNSGIRGFVSYKLFVTFPENPELSKILTPHGELTYEDLIRFDFDPNSSILLALQDF